MRQAWLAAAVLVLSAVAAQADLKIEKVKAVHGELGPERKSLETYVPDEVVFRYTVTGAKTNAEGRFDGTLSVQLANADGKPLVNQTAPMQVFLALGGGEFQSHARINLVPPLPAGEYVLTLTVKDNQALESANFERKLTVKEQEFALVRPRFFFDNEGKIPAPAGGVVGQTLHFRINVIGFDKVTGEIEADMALQLLDKDGKELLPKAMAASIKRDDADMVKRIASLTFQRPLVLNRAGDFTLRVTVTDKIGKKTATFETPLHVTAP